MIAYSEAAVLLATELGWPILPASRTTKRPCIKAGRDFAEHASRDPERIRRWFEVEFPGAAIAIPTGAASGLVVIDADAKHNGEARLAQVEGQLGPLPRTHVVRTQSGGIHVYCRHPGADARVRSGQGKMSPLGRLVGDGVDVRADGAIALVPPSAGYRWETAEGDVFPPLPEAWLEALRAPMRRPALAVAVPPPSYEASPDLAAARTELASLRSNYRRRAGDRDAERAELLDRLLAGRALAEPGGRDAAVTRAGFIVGRTLPNIGPDAAALLAAPSLIAIPTPEGDSENYTHWDRKFRDSYEAGSRAVREQHERDRLMWERIARSGGWSR